MRHHVYASLLAAAAALTACGGSDDSSTMSFFVTSTSPGRGAALGGLAGADAHCQSLASAAGAGEHRWRAYLSTTASGATAAVHARDRIGSGPWRNAQGVEIAGSVEALHGSANNLTKQTALTETGAVVNGRGDTPNVHDILTGSQPDGRATASGVTDTTCANWTSSATGAAIVGHSDRLGTSDTDAARSWNSSHATPGCSVASLRQTGGGGLFYCFAAE